MAQFRNSLNQVRVVLISVLLIIPLLLMGCWNRREVNDLNLVTAIGIDRIMVEGEPKYLLTLHSLNSAQTRSGADSSFQSPKAIQGTVLSMEGDTINDAGRNFALRNSRQMFLAHTQVLIIGEETARGGIDQIMEFCLRQRDVRFRTWVVVCEGTAREALQANPEIEALLSVEIDKLITKNKPRADKTVAVDIRKTAHALLTPGLELSVSNMKLFAPPELSSSTGKKVGDGITPEGNSSTEGSDGQVGGQVPPQKKSFMLSGAAVFQGDRMVGRFNEEEIQGLLFITNQARGGIIPFAFEASDINASFLYLKIKSRLKPMVNEDGSLGFEINLKGDGELLEQNNAAIDFSREDLEAAEKLINQEVERRCLMAIARAQELNTDVFGFGEKLHQFKPEVWKEVQERWGEVFPTVSVRLITDMKIAHTGLSDKPILIK